MKTINKILIIAAMTATSAVAVATTSSWALNVQNKTSAPFLVPELGGVCFPKTFIAKGASQPLPAGIVQAVCGGKTSGTCSADIYRFEGNSCSASNTKIGNVAIDLDSGAIVSSQMDSGYSLNVHGSTLTFS